MELSKSRYKNDMTLVVRCNGAVSWLISSSADHAEWGYCIIIPLL